MRLIISQKSVTPIYKQIVSEISSQILSRELLPETPLPSIRSVAKDLNISIITVKAAYEELEKQGVIYTRAGVGSFVAPYVNKEISDLRTLRAAEKLESALKFCKDLKLTKEELLELIDKLYT